MSLQADFDIIPLAALAGSFVAPYPVVVEKVVVGGVTGSGANTTALSVNGTTLGKNITLVDGAGVAKTTGAVASTTVGGNQPNDTGVGYKSVITPSVGNPVPVAVLAEGDVFSVATANATAGAVSVVARKK